MAENMTDNKWKKISSRLVYQNPWIKVREDKIVHPSGKPGVYGVVEIPPGIFTIAINKKQEILLVRQHHYPTGMSSWELPGGGLKAGYTPKMQAKEELSEEANAKVTSLRPLGKTQTQPGVTTEIDYYFLGEDAKIFKKEVRGIQRDEGIDRVKFFTFKQFLKMVEKGDISHGQTITGVMLYGLCAYKKSKL